MSVATRVLVQGNVVQRSERKGVSKQTGEVWERVDVLIFGPNCVAEVGFRGEAVKQAPALNAGVLMKCQVGVYRDDDTLDFEGYVEPAAAKA